MREKQGEWTVSLRRKSESDEGLPAVPEFWAAGLSVRRP